MDAGEYAAKVAFAESQQKRWGCPVAGHCEAATLPPDLEGEARYYAETVGLVPLRRPGKAPAPSPIRTCPLAASFRVGPSTRSALRLHRMLREYKGGLSAREILGRAATWWEIEALDLLTQADADVQRSNDAIREAERKAKEKTRP